MKLFCLTVAGLVSGMVCTYFSFSPVIFIPDSIWFMPGIIFAVFIYLGMMLSGDRFTTREFMTWLLISILGYYAATWMVILANAIWILAYFLAGGVGGYVMLLGFRTQLHPLSSRAVLLLSLVGGLLGIISGYAVRAIASLLIPNSHGLGEVFALPILIVETFFPAYIIWQTGMAVSLGIAMALEPKPIQTTPDPSLTQPSISTSPPS